MPDTGPLRPAPVHGPVFIIGAMGSGSTLLRLILDSHDNIAIPRDKEQDPTMPRDPAATEPKPSPFPQPLQPPVPPPPSTGPLPGTVNPILPPTPPKKKGGGGS